MAAALPDLGYMGTKAYTVFRGRLQFYFWLYETESGALVCMMEANLLGQKRTGAASGVATRWMAREDAETAGIIGAGWQARSQLEAVCRVRPVRRSPGLLPHRPAPRPVLCGHAGTSWDSLSPDKLG